MRKIAWMLAAVLTFGLLSASPAAHAADRDCSDFNNRRAAQKFFKKHHPKQDPHRLDADGDGKACESLPCPCGGGGDGSGPGHPPKRKKARVVRVVDGDTVKVKIPRRHKRPRRRTVRMIGIDTPEVYGGKECGGKKASRSLKRMLHKGTRITLVRDRSQDNKDRYGRILRYVIKRRGHFDVNRRQVWRGWAKVYVYQHNPFKRVKSYRKAARKAKRHDRGVWKVCGHRRPNLRD